MKCVCKQVVIIDETVIGWASFNCHKRCTQLVGKEIYWISNTLPHPENEPKGN